MLPYIEKLSLKQLSTLLIREIGLLVKCVMRKFAYVGDRLSM